MKGAVFVNYCHSPFFHRKHGLQEFDEGGVFQIEEIKTSPGETIGSGVLDPSDITMLPGVVILEVVYQLIEAEIGASLPNSV